MDSDSDVRNRRATLLQASARLFREKGFDGTSVRDIASAAGMRSGSPFYHFRSKQDILAAVIEQGLLGGLAALAPIATSSMPLRERFEALALAQLHLMLDEGHDFIQVLQQDWRSLNPDQQAHLNGLKDHYDSLWQGMAEALYSAGIIGVEPHRARMFILGSLNYTVFWYKPGQGASLEQLAQDAVALFLREAA